MPDQDPLYDLLRRTQPSLKQVFSRFRMPPDVVEEILEDCLMVLVYRHDQLAHPDRWLLRTVRFRCLRFWRQRRIEASRRGREEILRWLGDEECDAEERQRRQQELEGRLEDLPERCRQLLGEIFGLPAPRRPSEPAVDPAAKRGHRSRFPRGSVSSPESPAVRCMTQLLRSLLKDPPPDLEHLRLP